MKYLPPLALHERYYIGIERQIARILRRLIFLPLYETLTAENPELTNARPTSLAQAVEDGLVYYEDGLFKGRFNARISRDLIALDAKFNPRGPSWSLPLENVPPEVSIAQAHANLRYDGLRSGFFRTLDDINIESIDEHTANIEAGYIGAIDWIDGDFEKSVKGISIAPKLNQTQKVTLARDWANNLKLYIKKWAGDDIVRLREIVQQEAFAGRRAESLAKVIEGNFGVMQRKAKFLARQETALLMATFHESRYSELGITEYRWSTSKDERVRSYHRKLHGKIFSFDSPPPTNDKGDRNNPGEDFNCRCVAIPILRDTKERAGTPVLVD